ncbi:MAG: vitamin B12-dependent ribonucleotide reductase [Candidatus Tectomicrobia bacterium]|uniref:Vitamin B12-dependent ribonucleotide reductase n=1 Tax=Tectimicrobiota bacterium TaxID=2528274 RepID=A0A937W2V8_UNCTE|nr:vitamin B12-dependent ribonucleotide reductase [Candidatus Tectomicrobia bacterium]
MTLSTLLPPYTASHVPVVDTSGVLAPYADPAHGARREAALAGGGLSMQRYFTRDGISPYDEVVWEQRVAFIAGEDGRAVFEQRDIAFPQSWSQLATNVVASKYFRGPLGTPQRETSVRQLLDRVVHTITVWGQRGGYFATERDAMIFADELTHVLLHQRAAFNSPVWFNVGVEERPQASACFIISVEDSMESILEWYRQEGIIFKGGSGSGVNLSKIRGSNEQLSSGGIASGPLSFMRAADASAGAIKSGGKTRRAAKMVVLNIDHPDIEQFIRCKAEEEKKAWALIDAGYDASLDGAAYASVFFQNANNSVRIPDAFMHTVLNNGVWQTRYVTTGAVCQTYPARDLLHKIAEATHVCGDPGMQFDSAINDWHTCPNSGRINASNPCSEFVFLDDTACNLASINLLRFLNADGEFEVEAYRHAVDVLITAQEILVDNASYPTPEITRNSQAFRPLGLGYANLGALLMARGLPYDSDAGRAYAAAVTALMTGQAYLTSAKIAKVTGPFTGYAMNREPMLRVIRKHRDSLKHVSPQYVPHDLMQSAVDAWDDALALGMQYGYRNAQATVLAPTGTISFMMDCDTTGVEPDIALIKYKKLVGGGTMKIINATVPLALRRLGYPAHQVKELVQYIDEHETIEGAPFLQDEDLPVFDCAFRPTGGTRSIHYTGHIRMMAAVQPFLSGSISKTVNMPTDSTVEDIEQAYIMGWQLGVKALAVYRDGCKRTQPLNTRASVEAVPQAAKPVRRRLPDERPAITHKFSIAGHEGYITVGMFEDGLPGEIFLVMAKEGSTISGLMDAFATSISLALQYGVPLKALIDKFSHMRFEPAGFTNNKEIPIAKSVMDYIFRWLASKFLDQEDRARVGIIETADESVAQPLLPGLLAQGAAKTGNGHRLAYHGNGEERFPFRLQEDAPSCAECGALMIRNGACYKCLNCGATSGCS